MRDLSAFNEYGLLCSSVENGFIIASRQDVKPGPISVPEEQLRNSLKKVWFQVGIDGVFNAYNALLNAPDVFDAYLLTSPLHLRTDQRVLIQQLQNKYIRAQHEKNNDSLLCFIESCKNYIDATLSTHRPHIPYEDTIPLYANLKKIARLLFNTSAQSKQLISTQGGDASNSIDQYFMLLKQYIDQILQARQKQTAKFLLWHKPQHLQDKLYSAALSTFDRTNILQLMNDSYFEHMDTLAELDEVLVITTKYARLKDMILTQTLNHLVHFFPVSPEEAQDICKPRTDDDNRLRALQQHLVARLKERRYKSGFLMRLTDYNYQTRLVQLKITMKSLFSDDPDIILSEKGKSMKKAVNRCIDQSFLHHEQSHGAILKDQQCMTHILEILKCTEHLKMVAQNAENDLNALSINNATGVLSLDGELECLRDKYQKAQEASYQAVIHFFSTLFELFPLEQTPQKTNLLSTRSDVISTKKPPQHEDSQTSGAGGGPIRIMSRDHTKNPQRVGALTSVPIKTEQALSATASAFTPRAAMSSSHALFSHGQSSTSLHPQAPTTAPHHGKS